MGFKCPLMFRSLIFIKYIFTIAFFLVLRVVGILKCSKGFFDLELIFFDSTIINGPYSSHIGNNSII